MHSDNKVDKKFNEHFYRGDGLSIVGIAVKGMQEALPKSRERILSRILLCNGIECCTAISRSDPFTVSIHVLIVSKHHPNLFRRVRLKPGERGWGREWGRDYHMGTI